MNKRGFVGGFTPKNELQDCNLGGAVSQLLSPQLLLNSSLLSPL